VRISVPNPVAFPVWERHLAAVPIEPERLSHRLFM
jgi:hypothetical protein